MKFDKSFLLPIQQIVTENSRVKSFYFSYDFSDAKPGQFLMVWVPGFDEKPFGIVVVDANTFLISVAAVGDSTKALHEMKVGDKVGFRGPYGSAFTLPEHKDKPLAMVAGGYGMVPLGFLAKVAAEAGYTVDIFAGARSSSEFLLYPFFNDTDRITIHKATDDGSTGVKGFVTDAFDEYLKTTVPAQVYTVGPEIMEVKVAKVCYEKEIPFEVSLERYMKCGFGLCGQCCVDPTGWRMCVEGPVLNGEQLKQVKEFGVYHRNSSGIKIYY